VECQARMTIVLPSVLRIPHDRMADPGEMDPDLVLPARQQVYFQQRKSLVFLSTLYAVWESFPFVLSLVEYTV